MATIASFSVDSAIAAPRFVASSIDIDTELRDYWSADVNGDGRGDILLSTWNETRGRELHIHWQSADGKFSGTPSRRIEIKDDVIALGMAELRPDPGQELIMFTRSAFYSFNSNNESYTGNLQKLGDWDFVHTLAEPRQLGYLGTFSDLNGDKNVDLILPGVKEMGWFSIGNESTAKLIGRFPTPFFGANNGRDYGQIGFEIRNGLRFVVSMPSDFENLMETASQTRSSPANESEERRDVLDVEAWLPPVQVFKASTDDISDWIYIDDSPNQALFQRVNIIAPKNREQLPAEITWQGELQIKGALIVRDLNGDQLDDILVRNEQGSDQHNVFIYLNRGISGDKPAPFDFTKPDQVLRLSGYEMRIDVRDLNQDGKADLFAAGYSLSAVDAIRDGNMLRVLLMFEGGKGNEGAPFDRRPSFKLEEKFSASNFKGLVERVSFDADVDGDGRFDAIGLDHQGALVAKTVTKGLNIASDPFWRFVPESLIGDVRSQQLNQDAHADFILRHQRRLTVLVSQAGEAKQ